ncbi:MAG: hypothetical protein GY775_03505 [Candidatus Scalindua sp.]|nr:hypothetical protein [Candidatus Scalindua sp.]
MSTAIPCDDFISISNSPSMGFGDEVGKLKEFFKDIVRGFGSTETLGQSDKALQSLDKECDECSVEGWDGYDALPITKSTYNEAKRLIESLPLTTFPIPEVVPEPSGDIGLEWYREERQVFVASVSGRNEIVYAGLLGVNKLHGTEYFGDLLPTVILENLKRLYKD